MSQLEYQIQDAVPVSLSANEQGFIDTACQEMGIGSREEFLQRAITRLAELRSAWPDSFKMLMAS